MSKIGQAALKTGDVLLLMADRDKPRQIIRIMRKAEHPDALWTQAALVIRCPLSGRALVFEATSQAYCRPVNSLEQRSGVQRVLLEDKIRCFPGVIAVRQLSRNLDQHRTNNLHGFVGYVDGLPFESLGSTKLRRLLRKQFSGTNGTSYFCSQLVAESFTRIGLLPNSLPSANFSPTDFSDLVQLELANGYSLGEENYIKGTSAEHQSILQKAALPRSRCGPFDKAKIQ